MPLTDQGDKALINVAFGTASTPTYSAGLITITNGVFTASASYSVGNTIIPTTFATTTNKIFRCVVAGTASTEPTWAYSTTAATVAGASITPTPTTVNVASTSGFPTSGAFVIVSGGSVAYCTYSGTSSTTFTGVSIASGSISYSVGATITQTTTSGSAIFAEISSYWYQSANMTTEVSGGSYARQTLSNSNWNVPGSATTSPPASTYLTSAVNFPTSSASWGTVAAFGLWSNSSGGNLLAWNTLSNYVPVLVSGMSVTLPATTGLTISLT